MGQQDFGAASPIMDPIRRAYDRITGVAKKIPPKDEKRSPAPDSRLAEANESFRRSAQKTTKRTAKKTSKRK